MYASLAPAEKRDAVNTLAARNDSARAFLDAVAGDRVASRDLSADLVRQLRNHKNAAIDAQIGKVWGTVRDTSSDKTRLIACYRAMLRSPSAPPADRELGRAVFVRTCQ